MVIMAHVQHFLRFQSSLRAKARCNTQRTSNKIFSVLIKGGSGCKVGGDAKTLLTKWSMYARSQATGTYLQRRLGQAALHGSLGESQERPDQDPAWPQAAAAPVTLQSQEANPQGRRWLPAHNGLHCSFFHTYHIFGVPGQQAAQVRHEGKLG